MTNESFSNMMEGVGHYANIEWDEYSADAEPAAFEPQNAFVMGYVFGVALGLALSPQKPDLVEKMVKHFRQNRGWEF